jgi:O-antigen ligase
MKSGAERFFIPFLLGIAPALLIALTWSPSGDWTHLKYAIRDLQVPIIGAELFTIVVAVREGLLKALPRWDWSRPVIVATTLLVAIAVFTSVIAPIQGSAVLLTGYWMIHGAFGLSIAYLCGQLFAPQDLVRAYMIGFAIVAAEFFLFLYQIPDWTKFDWRSGLLAFGHVRHAGYYLAAVAALAIGTMAVAQRRSEWAWAFATAGLAVGIALWTGSRGAVLAVAGALVVGFILAPPVRSVRGFGGGLASMALAAAVVAAVPAAPNYLMGLNRTVEATASGNITTGRTTIWQNVIGAVQERPVFGYGEGQMREVAPFSTMVQPHNFVLQVALAWGLIGLMCVLTLAIAFLRRAIPVVWREGGALVPPLMAMGALAVLSLYDGSLYYALPISLFVSCGAIILSSWKSRVEDQHDGAPVAAGAF